MRKFSAADYVAMPWKNGAGDAILIDATGGDHVDLSVSAPAILYVARFQKRKP